MLRAQLPGSFARRWPGCGGILPVKDRENVLAFGKQEVWLANGQGERTEYFGCGGDVLAHDRDTIKAVRERHHAPSFGNGRQYYTLAKKESDPHPPADQPIRRLEPDNAAVRGR